MSVRESHDLDSGGRERVLLANGLGCLTDKMPWLHWEIGKYGRIISSL